MKFNSSPFVNVFCHILFICLERKYIYIYKKPSNFLCVPSEIKWHNARFPYSSTVQICLIFSCAYRKASYISSKSILWILSLYWEADPANPYLHKKSLLMWFSPFISLSKITYMAMWPEMVSFCVCLVARRCEQLWEQKEEFVSAFISLWIESCKMPILSYSKLGDYMPWTAD